MGSTGVISLGDNSELATIPAPGSSQVPFACDGGGNVFEAAVGGRKVVVTRVSASGAISTVSGALTPGVANGINGPVSTYSNPGVVALLPDGQGSAWIVSEVGTQASTTSAAAYPSLAHVVFAP
jgi:hypothetical protein